MLRLEADARQTRKIGPAIRNVSAPLLDKALHEVVRHAGRQIGSRPKSRTGRLARAWGRAKVKVKAKNGVATGSIRVGHKGVNTLESGDTLRPKRGKYLTIRLAAAGRRKPRSIKGGLIAIKTKTGHLLLAQKKGEDITPFFILVPVVRIAPTRYVTTAARAADRGAGRIGDSLVERELKRARV